MKFFLLLDPPTVTAQRKKIAVTKKGKPIIYDSISVKEAKELFRKYLAPFVPLEPLKGPLELRVQWIFEKGTIHKNQEWRSTKPDTDNLEKLLKDQMTKLKFWKDDAQVCVEHVEKYWSDEPAGIDIIINPLPKFRVPPTDEDKNGNRKWRALSTIRNSTTDEERKNYTQEGCERLAAAIVEDAINSYRDTGYKIKDLKAKYKANKITKKKFDEELYDLEAEKNNNLNFFKSQKFANLCQIDKDWLIQTLDEQIANYVPKDYSKGGNKHGRI